MGITFDSKRYLIIKSNVIDIQRSVILGRKRFRILNITIIYRTTIDSRYDILISSCLQFEQIELPTDELKCKYTSVNSIFLNYSNLSLYLGYNCVNWYIGFIWSGLKSHTYNILQKFDRNKDHSSIKLDLVHCAVGKLVIMFNKNEGFQLVNFLHTSNTFSS